MVDSMIKSSCGKYELSIDNTSSSGWQSRGTVKSVADGSVIAVVERNYHSFPYLFISAHKNEHDYLVCGEDYQGQTVIELDTGKRRDYLPAEAAEGHGFCWAGYELMGNILLVDGCYWACPYEFRFYDFSDPMNGWPQLEYSDDYVDVDNMKPTINVDGTITTYKTGPKNEDDDDDVERILLSSKTYRREGNKLELISKYISREEALSIERREKYQKEYDAWLLDFRNNDEFYKTFLELTSKYRASEYFLSIGIIHENWCKDYVPVNKNERRICCDIIRVDGLTASVEWGVEAAPVKLIVYVDGKLADESFFPHSVEGLRSAISKAVAFIVNK